MGAVRRLGIDRPDRLALLVLAASALTMLTAFGFEYLGGYRPCPLCLQQRYAYYFAFPATFGALLLIGSGRLPIAGLILAAVALGFLVNAGLGLYHAGVEWHWWAGPTACAEGGGAPTFGGGRPLDLGQTVIRCDEAPWRLAGLSFAGWNTLISLALALTAGLAAWRCRAADPEAAAT